MTEPETDFLCSHCAIAHGWVKDPTRQMTINQAPAFICCVCGKSDVAGADRRDFGVTAGMVAATIRERTSECNSSDETTIR